MNRRQVALLAGFGALAPLSIDMYLPAMPQLAAALGVSVREAGQSVSVFFAGIAAGQLIAGPLSDRFGRRPLIIAGLAVYIAGSIACAMTPGFGMLLAGRLLQALGACSVTVAGRAVVRDRLDHGESARLFSLLALVAGVAPVLAPSLGNLVLSAGSWRGTFLVMAVGAVLLLAGTVKGLAESRSEQTARQAGAEHLFRSYGHLLGNRVFVGHLLAATFNSASMFAYIANSPAVLMEQYGVSRTVFGLLFAVNAVGLVGANQLNRILLKTRTPNRILRGSARNALVMSALFAILAVTRIGGLPLLLAMLFVVMSSISVIQANTLAGALSVDPSRAGSASALFGSLTFAGGSVASLVAGAFDWPGGAGLCATVAACLLGCAVAIRMGQAEGQAAVR